VDGKKAKIRRTKGKGERNERSSRLGESLGQRLKKKRASVSQMRGTLREESGCDGKTRRTCRRKKYHVNDCLPIEEADHPLQQKEKTKEKWEKKQRRGGEMRCSKTRSSSVGPNDKPHAKKKRNISADHESKTGADVLLGKIKKRGTLKKKVGKVSSWTTSNRPEPNG